MELTLTECFGSNVSQDINSLIIKKSDLPGLTSDNNNTSEELVAAIFSKILENFEGRLTDENDNALTNEFNQPLTFNQGDFVDTFYLFNWRITFVKRKGDSYKRYQLVFQEFEPYEE